MEQDQIKKLKRSARDRIVGGVCGGLGEYFEIDPIIFRLMFVILTIFAGSGVLLYIILWILIPDENEKRTDEKDLKKNIKEGASKMAEEIKKTHIEGNGKNLVGAIILIIGLIFLLDNFFPWLKVGMDKLWPLIIVVIGAAILVGGGRSRG